MNFIKKVYVFINPITIIFMIIIGTFFLEEYKKALPVEPTRENFAIYQLDIEKVLQNYGYKMEEVLDSNSQNNSHEMRQYFHVKINDNTGIDIYFYNSGKTESFNILFVSTISDIKDINKNIDIPLFVALVNTVSGKQITEDFCKGFLEAQENKYKSFNKSEEQLINKTHVLNFWEEWRTDYVLSNDLYESFDFGGLTKQSRDL